MVRVRIPPSPTGWLHIGTARTALFNFLFARNQGGKIVFRSEDTDKERSKKEFEEDIINGLQKLGITWDEGPFLQSERSALYQKHVEELLAKNAAYYCFCSKEVLEATREKQMAEKLPPRYVGTCSGLDPQESQKRVAEGTAAVIRLRVALDQDLRFQDLVRGETVIMSKELDDFVIAKKTNECLYNFTVVIDDHDMEITHVIRGEDHISNTPKQILIYRAFGWPLPAFAHLPLILNEDKTKMSKRKNKVSLNEYFAEGYLPEALINFLALLGWNPGDTTQEIFSMDELIQQFSLERVHKGGAIFDHKRLDWVNDEYIKKAIAEDVDKFCEDHAAFIPFSDPQVKSILKHPDFEGRFKKLTEITEALSVFFNPLPVYDKELLMNEKFKITPDIVKTVFEHAIAALENLEWQKADATKTQLLSDSMTALCEALGLKPGQVLWPIRAALSGTEKSPNFATLMVYLGKEETLNRLQKALSLVG